MILVTGGAGYIGSHTVVELLNAHQQVLVLDNFSNSSAESLRRVETITGQKVSFVKGDIRDAVCLQQIFSQHDISAVVHFAGLKAVPESMEKPLEYYDNNVNGTLALCQAMRNAGVFNLVFSSSAAIYGDADVVPVPETAPIGRTINPYGTSKYMIERILSDLAKSDPRWSIALLRYFNPTGAHESGLIGEDPGGIPTNLVPYIAQVAVGNLEFLNVFGNDYDTHDGTGIRDFIHVVDLALGHLHALEALARFPGCNAWNLGTGVGYSVLDMVAAFERAAERAIPYRVAPRREGDIAISFSDPSRAARDLGWHASRGLDDMMRDMWRWQSRNPNGYR